MFLKSEGYGAWNGVGTKANSPGDADVLILGIPFDGGAGGQRGAAFAPGRVRSMTGRLKSTSRRGDDLSSIRILDIGDVDVSTFDAMKTFDAIECSCSAVLDGTDSTLVSIGGDHSVTHPILKAVAKRGRTGVIWFDAHPDLLDTYHGFSFSHGSALRRAIETT